MTAQPSTSTITATSSAPSSKLELNEPNATLYIANIDWKIKKAVLRRALHTLFGRHGKILEIITLRKEGLRGQAWVIFDSISSATAALQAEQNFTFFGKDLKVSYAREKSDRIAKRDGTFVPMTKEKRMEEKKRRMEAEKSAAAAAAAAEEAKLKEEQQGGEKDGDEAVTKKMKLEDGTSSSTTVAGGSEPAIDSTTNNLPPPPPPPSAAMTSNETPSNILFAENLPPECNEMMISMLFRQYPGFKEVRIPRPGLAFVEFDDEPHATVGLTALNGFKLTANEVLNLKYGKSS